MTLVVDVVTLVDVATGPSVDAFAMFEVAPIFSLIAIAVLVSSAASPLALSVLLALLEVPNVDCTIWVAVFTFAVSLAVLELACVCLAVCKGVRTLAVLEAHVPLSFVLVAIRPLVHAVAMCLRVLPLSDVGVIVDSLPDAVAFFATLLPLAIVHFTVLPGVNSLPMRLSLGKLTKVSVTIGVPFKALAVT